MGVKKPGQVALVPFPQMLVGRIGEISEDRLRRVQKGLADWIQGAVGREEEERVECDALALNRKGIEYGALARDAASNRQIFESLMQRTKETGISGELKTSNIRVVDSVEGAQVPLYRRQDGPCFPTLDARIRIRTRDSDRIVGVGRF